MDTVLLLRRIRRVLAIEASTARSPPEKIAALLLRVVGAAQIARCEPAWRTELERAVFVLRILVAEARQLRERPQLADLVSRASGAVDDLLIILDPERRDAGPPRELALKTD